MVAAQQMPRRLMQTQPRQERQQQRRQRHQQQWQRRRLHQRQQWDSHQHPPPEQSHKRSWPQSRAATGRWAAQMGCGGCRWWLVERQASVGCLSAAGAGMLSCRGQHQQQPALLVLLCQFVSPHLEHMATCAGAARQAAVLSAPSVSDTHKPCHATQHCRCCSASSSWTASWRWRTPLPACPGAVHASRQGGA